MTSRLLLNGHTLDFERAELRDAQGDLVQLRPRALALLLELARHAGEVVTKRDLLARVWPDSVVTDDSLVQCVVEIRRELGDAQQRIVRTVPRRGYLLMPDGDPARAPHATKPSWYRGRHAALAAAGK